MTSVAQIIKRALEEAGGAFVPVGTLAEKAYGQDDATSRNRVTPHIDQLRKAYGRKSIINEPGKGYAWRGQ